MKTVNIADLKANLSSYLEEVADGHEIIVRNRKKPVARIVPFERKDAHPDELKLVSEGKLRLATRKATPLFWKEFWSLDRPKVHSGDGVKALIADRNER